MHLWKTAGLLIALVSFVPASGQVRITDDYLRLQAGAKDPLFTTYAAPMARSRFFADKAYFMDYFTPDKPITYSSQFAGDLAVLWKFNNVVIAKTREFARAPVVVASFPDMAVLEYEPFAGVKVQETFCVYSSGSAVIELHMANTGTVPLNVMVYPVLHLPNDSLRVVRYEDADGGYIFAHHEELVRLHSNLYKDRGYPTGFRNMLSAVPPPSSYGAYARSSMDDLYFAIKRLSKVHENVTALNQAGVGPVDAVMLQSDVVLRPGEQRTVRFVRSVQDAAEPETALRADARGARTASMQQCVDENVALFRTVPRVRFRTPGEKIVYIGAFNLVRQCMLPPTGQTTRNFYVFSRNPVWGWGHGHQVMHESLSMIPYVYLDARSAEESQRIYMDQQYEDGLIAYRHGPRGPQVYPHEGVPTTSAPFFTWTNWEMYTVTKNRAFLKDAYASGARYIRYMETERDRDGDGMYEWGPYGIIENVRDGWNVVFQLFSEGTDEGRDISHELDVLDLTAEMANEMYHLRQMARELGDTAGVREWTAKFDRTAALINRHMWDPQDRFYYNVSMDSNSFVFEGASLKRKELIGFLPMWAHVASKQQAAELVKHLTDPTSFWRKYGVPTIAANDPQYTPFVDGCCRWNGPVWLLWDYIVMRGLRNYGYDGLADKVGAKMMDAVTTQLSINHRFWESYSPDFPVQESPSNYIWDAIMAKVLLDMYHHK
ncbi:MAG: hypothetical protein IPI01_11740 [Ignavibacteriae bacterium]|nr:hypothetical protein [Ignavibacteriota bacterium]